MIVLAADIGGTKTLLGPGEAAATGVRWLARFASARYAGLARTQPLTARSLRNALAVQPANRRPRTA